MEIHDELAAQIANSTEEVEYIDGVSSIEEEDEDDASETKSQIDSLQQDDTKDKEKGKKDGEEEEVQVDTFRVIGIRRIQGQCLVSSMFQFSSFLSIKYFNQIECISNYLITQLRINKYLYISMI